MILLASASLRRQQLLDQIGVSFTVLPQDVDESLRAGEEPADYVQRVAIAKAQSALPQLQQHNCRLVLAADTAVVCDGRVLGKPQSETEAVAMLLALAGREHRVLTAVTAGDANGLRQLLSESRVSFRDITEAEARAYWRSGEPGGKAGGYAIQGLAAIFVSDLHGSYSGVMGLPLYETACLLQQFAISCLPVDKI
ncbi:MAG: Maf family protein [Gammaproteobacteria bacterium]